MGKSLEISKAGALWVFSENRIFKPIWVSKNLFVWMDLSIGSVLERLVLKNAAERTSQRLKWTSEARVMIVFGRSVSIARSLGRSIARSLGRSIARSLGSWVARSRDRLVARSLENNNGTKIKPQWDDNGTIMK